MTWSPFFTEVTAGPTSTTMPAPSWPRIAGNRPSGSAPDRVYSSVWQMPVALISTSTSPSRGPAMSTVSRLSGCPAWRATAARVFMVAGLLACLAPSGCLVSIWPEGLQIGDDVSAFLRLFQAGKDHQRLRHHFLRIGQVFVQLLRTPDDAGITVCRGIFEPGIGAGLAAD